MTVFIGAVRTSGQRVAPEPKQDLSALTVATLRGMCEDRGIEAPKRATKAQLVVLLTE